MVIVYNTGDVGSIPGQVVPETQKWYLMLLCLTLSIIMYGTGIRGAIQRKEHDLPLHLSGVAIEKSAFGSPSIMTSQHTHYYCLQSIKPCANNIYKYHSQEKYIKTSLSVFLELSRR